MYRQTEHIINCVQTMLKVKRDMPKSLVDILEEIEAAAQLLKKDINKYCQIWLSVKATGQASGVAGGVLTAAGALSGKSGMVKAGAVLTGANFVSEVIVAAADWFADHAKRFDKLMANLEGAKAVGAMVRFPAMPKMPIEDKETARAGAMVLAGELLATPQE